MKTALFLSVIVLSACMQPHKKVVKHRHAQGPPVAYGTIYSKSAWTDTADFTPNGARCSISSAKIILTHNAAISTLDLNYNSLLEHWCAVAKFKALTDSATAGIGIRSVCTYQTFGTYACIDFNTGKLVIHCTKNALDTTVCSSAHMLTIQSNDRIILSLRRSIDTLYASATDVATGSTVTASYAYSTSDYTVPSPNTGKFSLYINSGTCMVDSVAITTDELKNANILMATDSKGMYVADSFSSRWTQRITDTYKPTVLSVGGSDGINELAARLPEIIGLQPAKVLLLIGRNDLAGQMNIDTLKARYARVVTVLQDAGIDVYHVNCIYETSIDQSDFSSWITSTYGENVIDTYSATGEAKNGLYVDGIHPNQAGNNLIASVIINSGKLK